MSIARCLMPLFLVFAFMAPSPASQAQAGGSTTDNEPATLDISDFSCQQLWFGRNSIYKEAGYCFKTPRAIAAFGNAGCRYDNAEAVPLTQENRNRVQAFQRAERAKTCSN